MKLINLVSFIISLQIVLQNYVTEATKKYQVQYRKNNQHLHYWNKYYYNRYRYRYRYVKWPKVRGRCKIAPKIELNGRNPIIEGAAKGNVVVVTLTKKGCTYCLKQLESLNDMAEHYR